jgi:hypothetical protein
LDSEERKRATEGAEEGPQRKRATEGAEEGQQRKRVEKEDGERKGPMTRGSRNKMDKMKKVVKRG